MSTLSDIGKLLVQSTICEIEELEKGNIKTANSMLSFRHMAYNYVHMAYCFQDSYDENKALVDFIYEQAKEISFLIINKKF